MKTVVLDKLRPSGAIQKNIIPLKEIEAKNRHSQFSTGVKKLHRLRPKYWDGEFDGLWCDEEFY